MGVNEDKDIWGKSLKKTYEFKTVRPQKLAFLPCKEANALFITKHIPNSCPYFTVPPGLKDLLPFATLACVFGNI